LLLASLTSSLSMFAANRKVLDSGWQFRQHNIGEWYPAIVPGTVHLDLARNSLIQDPFYGVAQPQLQWIDKTEWEYSCSFDVTGLEDYGNARLVFEGLDCFADVFLNGEQILSTDNMFRKWTAEVRELLKSRDNELTVIFHSPVWKGLEAMTSYGVNLTANNDLSHLGGLGDSRVSVYTRKSGYQFGWDFAPRYVTSGIWKPVCLELWDDARIEDFYVSTERLEKNRAVISAKTELVVSREGQYKAEIILDGKVVGTYVRELSAGNHCISDVFDIWNPKLWYPHTMGEPHLYNVQLRLSLNDKTVDAKDLAFGVRTVKLHYEDDDQGRSFFFEINGKPVFCKGVNMVPQDSFVPDADQNRLKHLLGSVVDANMNMIRVWGGGVYESDSFYELCDRLGIMVWQDFIFACDMYPGGDDVYDNIRNEAAENVKRLRSHPSLVLWCGNNEIDSAWKPGNPSASNWRKKHPQHVNDQFDKVNEHIFRGILPSVVDSLYADGIPYWHSSPSPGWMLDKLPKWQYGDVHNWDIWHRGDSLTAYNNKIARFTSEYGLQSYPEYSSVKRFIPDEDLYLNSPSISSHQGDKAKGDKRILEYIDQWFNRRDDFPYMLYLSQMMQGEGVRIAMEAHRRNMPYSMGSLVWQLNDVWPCASWSVVDYYGRWKAAMYMLKRSCEPVILSSHTHSGMIDFHIVSDLGRDLKGKFTVSLQNFTGNVISEKTLDATIPATSSVKVLTVSEIELLNGMRAEDLMAVCTFKGKGVEVENIHYFVLPKYSTYPNARLSVSVSKTDDGLCRIGLSSDGLIKGLAVYLDCVAGEMSDNYFDLLPGRVKEVTVKTGLPLEDLKQKLTFECLNESIIIEK
ncbi:MAG: glycosyl hydrolase 2 galactose-binding domain-containing protein, partial [Candidatus Cryptobacteroides sp.]